jgi:hypothetical protein
MLDQGLAGAGAGAVDDVKHSRWHSQVVAQLGQQGSGGGRDLTADRHIAHARWVRQSLYYRTHSTYAIMCAQTDIPGLGDDSVSHHHGRGNLPGEQVKWQVPRGNKAHHADGASRGVIQTARITSVAISTKIGSNLGEIAEVVHRSGDVNVSGPSDGLACNAKHKTNNTT